MKKFMIFILIDKIDEQTLLFPEIFFVQISILT